MVTIEFEPVATVVGGHLHVQDDYQAGVKSIIRINEKYPLETLQGIEEFSHLLVLWHFHLARPEDIQLHARSPRGNARWPATGTFVHCNHRRPNQLGTSTPELLDVDGRDLLVTGLDAVDGTPIVDVKPYMLQFAPPPEKVRQPAWPGEMLADYWRDASERP
ncbi:transcriptional regulator [Streptomyces albidoflavus]|uniref:SAM-dependent methyltransferase n=1 Tax=Streptomyces albidoflavus TaxID=1886 RepID=UPI000BAE5917|nr:SAM-dependent methyltransferase [Streptomyces albidoflavus]PAX87234.1 transcriptional regulator [Streptomyces albidoflavus]PAX90008.1 transcriptional regulator [Streptomyces albidoflavus]PBO19654.1 transcriptional regulator [Streptomyces albidoflavus]PBO24008.1 transcriptional regulator [Streptomyces albidoflavus]PBO30488.1 transcriptional regulator [Streptomyces albidoflavus]